MSYWSQSFAGDPERMAEVRRAVEAVVGSRPRCDEVVLCIHELAVNAVLHTASGEPGGTFTVHIAEFSDRWQIRVDDAGGPSVARQRTAAEGDEGGRGLLLVESLATFWRCIDGGIGCPGAILAEIPFEVAPDGDARSAAASVRPNPRMARR